MENTKQTYELAYNGDVDGIRIAVGDEDFVLLLHDEDGEYEWQEACDKFNLPTVKQARIIAAYLPEIQQVLREHDGDELGDKWYWTKSECTANGAWLYNGGNGVVTGNNKSNSYSVRTVLASNA